MSFNPAVPDTVPDLDSHGLHRSHSEKSIPRACLIGAPSLPDLFKPLPKVVIHDIDASGGALDCLPERKDQVLLGAPKEDVTDELDQAERTSRFWANFDREERGSVVSAASQEFGETRGERSNIPRLRKHRSAIHARHRLFNISTTSFHNKLRKKTRSAGALREPKVVERIENLPLGVHQIGSGIGFTYSIPTAVPSKASLCSFTPQTCHTIFHGGFSGLNLGLGIGHASRREKGTPGLDPSYDAHSSMLEHESSVPTSRPTAKEVSNGTFIRDMYRTPSWILSPPESLPSPLALVNSNSSSPQTDSEPLTPATLVDGELDNEEINISIPKSVEFRYDFPGSALGSTLRLVPRSAARLSFLPTGDMSLTTELSGL